jgi:hypothetical protein
MWPLFGISGRLRLGFGRIENDRTQPIGCRSIRAWDQMDIGIDGDLYRMVSHLFLHIGDALSVLKHERS